MNIFNRKWLAALSACLFVSGVQAAEPIHLTHGQGTGGTTDALARLLGQEWSARLDRQVVVESRPGAATSLAASLVAKAAPDGRNVLFTASGHSANPYLLPTLPYDTARDFQAVAMVASTPYVLVTTASLPVNNVAELVAHLKKQNGSTSVAVTSIGSAQHISAALFKKMAGVDIEFIPYKGSAAQASDVISGRVPVAFDNIVAIASQIRAGTLKPLAVTSRQRSFLFPDVPTLTESGYPDFEIVGWFGALVARDTPEKIVQSYNDATVQAKADPAFIAKVQQLGAEIMPGDSKDAEAFVQADLKKMEVMIRDLGISLN